MRCYNLNAQTFRSCLKSRGAMYAVVIGLAIVLWGGALNTNSLAQSDRNSLPEDVAAMRDAILDAAKTGKIEEMGLAIELNELPPTLGDASDLSVDPVDALAAMATRDGETGVAATDHAAFLAKVAAILALPPARDGNLFVWPYLALRDRAPLTDAETADLETFMTEAEIRHEQGAATYTGYLIEIGSDGTWHYLGRRAPAAAKP